MKCNGTGEVCIKTLHGRFQFRAQRFGTGEQATSWLEQSGQVLPGNVSRRLGEFSAYYANRLSDEEVEALMERVRGEKRLTDQTISASSCGAGGGRFTAMGGREQREGGSGNGVKDRLV